MRNRRLDQGGLAGEQEQRLLETEQVKEGADKRDPGTAVGGLDAGTSGACDAILHVDAACSAGRDIAKRLRGHVVIKASGVGPGVRIDVGDRGGRSQRVDRARRTVTGTVGAEDSLNGRSEDTQTASGQRSEVYGTRVLDIHAQFVAQFKFVTHPKAL